MEWAPLCSLIATVHPASTCSFKVSLAQIYSSTDIISWLDSLKCWEFSGLPCRIKCSFFSSVAFCTKSPFPSISHCLHTSPIVVRHPDCRFVVSHETFSEIEENTFGLICNFHSFTFKWGASAFKTLRRVSLVLSWHWSLFISDEGHKSTLVKGWIKYILL